MRWYRNKEKVEKDERYDGDWGSKLLFKATSATLEVNGRQREEELQGCTMCGEVKETLEHFRTECEGYKIKRLELDKQVSRAIGRKELEIKKEREDRGMWTILGLTEIKDSDSRAVRHMEIFLMKIWTQREKNN